MLVGVQAVTTWGAGARQAVHADRLVRSVEWCLAFSVVLSLGLDPALSLWHVASTAVPPEFRTVSLSASDLTLLILTMYGWSIRHGDAPTSSHPMRLAIVFFGAILTVCVGLSAFVAGAPWLSLSRIVQVGLGLLACLTLAKRRSLADRVLVCGAGLILLQLPQIIVQEISQTSVSLGSPIPGWPPVTAARVSGALIVFGPGNERWQRGMGSFLHPNLLGGFLALAIVFSLPWLARGGRHAMILWPIWAVAWLELLLTFSRSALLAALTGCLLWGIAQFRQTLPRRRVAFAGIPIALGGALAVVLSRFFLPRFNPSGVIEGASVTDRLHLMRIAARVIAAHPLLGVGAGNFSLAEARLPLASISGQPVHIVPLLVTSEAGIVAGLAWLGLVVGVPIVGLRAKRSNARLCCERMAIPVVIVVLASFDHYFWSFAPGQALFWVSLGVWASHQDATGELVLRRTHASHPVAS